MAVCREGEGVEEGRKRVRDWGERRRRGKGGVRAYCSRRSRTFPSIGLQLYLLGPR